ncbi:alpha/beta hydrolase [Acholeplasma equirhinis]|uniref:alpha/beta hydrolase n=1 Tax=Acholeplasma equirhinis TaxID=555393 RepID=UPI00197AD0D7|nr:alpha/beta hydrolase-fold protein [Acholeplasma equirhinis]MBN3490722.1 alpha/beta hydrolase [Acholeplasma equirhinis]
MIKHISIYSNILKMNRDLRIFIPDQIEGPYQVLYMHDGQNLFNDKDAAYGTSWRIGETLESMIHAAIMKPMMIVGIDNNSDRLIEYSPVDVKTIEDTLKIKFEKPYYGESYVDFIANELKPFIDQSFNTLKNKENTFIAGSSMGGVISLFAGLKYKNIFGRIGMLSNASWYNQQAYLNLINSIKPSADQRYFITVGSNESSKGDPKDGLIYIKTNEELADALRKYSNHIYFRVYEGAIHNESFWRIVSPEMLFFLTSTK